MPTLQSDVTDILLGIRCESCGRRLFGAKVCICHRDAFIRETAMETSDWLDEYLQTFPEMCIATTEAKQRSERKMVISAAMSAVSRQHHRAGWRSRPCDPSTGGDSNVTLSDDAMAGMRHQHDPDTQVQWRQPKTGWTSRALNEPI